jgi:hypothetical protein
LDTVTDGAGDDDSEAVCAAELHPASAAPTLNSDHARTAGRCKTDLLRQIVDGPGAVK